MKQHTPTKRTAIIAPTIAPTFDFLTSDTIDSDVDVGLTVGAEVGEVLVITGADAVAAVNPVAPFVAAAACNELVKVVGERACVKAVDRDDADSDELCTV
jgi:hypothetical protein